MSTFSDEMAAVALDLLTEFGQTVTFNRSVYSSYDPTDGTTDTPVNTTWTAKAYPDDYKNTEIDGKHIQQGDIKLYSEASSSNVPDVNDYVTVSGRAYKVMDSKYITINAENVLYELQLRI